jgi:hypothetical protein
MRLEAKIQRSGIGVDVGVAAPGFRRCAACVAFVVVLLGVGSGHLGGSAVGLAVGLAGARSWDRCVWVAVVRMSESCSNVGAAASEAVV